MRAVDLSLYLVADPDHCPGDLVTSVQRAISGGVTCVQLRAKSLTDREHLALASRLRAVCTSAGVPFLVNDRLDIAQLSGADGIHLGIDDLPVREVRDHTPQGFVIGFSPATDAQIAASAAEGVDYLGVGPVFGTTTKANAGAALGLDEFARRCALTPLPVVGIGGITTGNAGGVLERGAAGVAVVSAVLGARDPAAAAAAIRRHSGKE